MTPAAPVPLMTMSARASSLAERLEGRGTAAERGGELLRFLERAPAEHGRTGPVPHHLPRGQLAHLPRAHQQDRAVAQFPEDLPRQFDGDMRDRHGVASDGGLVPYALCRSNGPVPQRVQDRPQRAGLLRDQIGALDLPEDLGLAQHHRIEARSDAEGVTHCCLALEAVEMRGDFCRLAAVSAREERGHGVERCGANGPAVHLDPVAGGEDHRLGETCFLAHAPQGGGERVFGKGERFAHRDRRRVVVQADDNDHSAATATAGTSVAQAKVKTIIAKPAMASQAARRPPHPPRQRATRSTT